MEDIWTSENLTLKLDRVERSPLFGFNDRSPLSSTCYHQKIAMKNLFQVNNIPLFMGLIFVGIFLAFLFNFLPAFPAIALKNLEEMKITEILWGALFITLIVERSLEVFISTWRDSGKLIIERLNKKKESLSNKRKAVEELEAKIIAGIDDSDLLESTKQKIKQKEEAISKLSQEIEQEEQVSAKDIEQYQTGTQTFAFFGGFLLGLCSSFVGIRILEPLVVITDIITAEQQRAFIGLDILLTALAISGGSKIFHLLVSTVTDFTAQTRSQINTPPGS